MKNTRFAFLLAFAAVGHWLAAQDAHFSQLLRTGAYLNPALTANFDPARGQTRLAAQYRKQWSFAPSYRDFLASAERCGQTWQFGGLAWGHDAGAASLRSLGFQASAALWRPLGPTGNGIALGASVGVAQQSIDPAALAFESQFDPERGYQSSLSNNENFATTKLSRPDAAIGLVWKSRFFNEKMALTAGASLAHVQQPSRSFFADGAEPLAWRKSFHASARFRAGEQLSLAPFGWSMRQGHFRVRCVGLEAAVPLAAAELQFSAGRRIGDAWMLAVGLDFGAHSLGLSYDINNSSLTRASNGQGGWELAYAHFLGKSTAKKLKMPKKTDDDLDGDGVLDDADDCPTVAGLRSLRGCPKQGALDSDGDGIMDEKDRCPDEPGLIRLAGCPDSDGDGLSDFEDDCPHLPGPKSKGGCPTLAQDADDDSVIDADDDCPYIKGSASFHGCPDTDGDGVPDLSDGCPFLRGPASNKGCPTDDGDTEPAGKRPAPSVLVEFDTDQSEIKARFFTPLDRMAGWLLEHPESHLMIAGHTDTEGDGPYNFRLGLRRAQALHDYFIARRIEPDRVKIISYGENIPKTENASAYGKARNRRAEAILIK